MNKRQTIKTDGTTLGQLPNLNLPEPKPGHKADAAAILRTKKPKLKRRYAQQRLSKDPTNKELQSMANRPERRKK